MKFRRFVRELCASKMCYRRQYDHIRSVNGFDPIEGLAFAKGYRFKPDDIDRLRHAAEFLGLSFDVMVDIVRASEFADLDQFPRAQRYRRVLLKYLGLF